MHSISITQQCCVIEMEYYYLNAFLTLEISEINISLKIFYSQHLIKVLHHLYLPVRHLNLNL